MPNCEFTITITQGFEQLGVALGALELLPELPDEGAPEADGAAGSEAATTGATARRASTMPKKTHSHFVFTVSVIVSGFLVEPVSEDKNFLQFQILLGRFLIYIFPSFVP